VKLALAGLLGPCFLLAVDFQREVKPILSDRCFSCHGPDEANRKAGLRLDTEAGLKGKLNAVLERVTSTSAARRMPPAYSGVALTAAQQATLRSWMGEGAPWQKHWSLVPPVRTANATIDSLVDARLAREGWRRTAKAAPATLLRRVTLDLTGLPPSLDEQQAFLSGGQTYEQVVDRLLASPRYAERMTARWLDAARYADTNGYQTDAERFMWRWRDWVLDAFARNMPFDQFTVEQLAGDLLPNATREQIIATGFNRNHRANGEGGSLDAEFLVEYAIDRVETTSTVWLGLTAGCARCHDHKYDPLSQREFYSLYAFFNNLPEKGKVFKYGNSPPVIAAPTPEQDRMLAAWDAKLSAAERRFAALQPQVDRGFAAWQQTLAPGFRWAPTFALAARQHDGAWVDAAGQPIADLAKAAKFGFRDKFTLAARIRPTAATGAILTKAVDQEEQPGYGLYLRDGKLQVNLVQRWLDDCLRVETVDALPLNGWAHVAMTYDGSLVADGVRIYVNGQPQRLKYIVDDLNQTFETKEPLRWGAGNGMRWQGEIAEARVYGERLTPAEVQVLAGVAPALAQRSAFLQEHAASEVRAAWSELESVRRQRQSFVDQLPTVMVMREMAEPRAAHVLNRGQYDRPGAVAPRAIPAALGALPPGEQNRLTLARWIVSRENPLTARVTVNRFWQMFFGTGLVKTPEDFGAQGETPTHPELLDWLAVEFMESGWDVKRLLKTIVMSETYQQDAHGRHLERDPENRLLARGPRLRLPPEMVRDQALLAAGLLVEKLGGPSVKPYQPAGLWKELSGGEDYQRDQGENLYRRSLYTFWKRAAPPPGLMTFDSAGREACTVRENRTNTPMQALALMNDETYLEAARKMAERMMRARAGVRERISHGFQLVLARPARAAELDVLEATWRRNVDRLQTSGAAALLAQGDSPVDAALPAHELGAYTMVASAILNLDEAVTKE